MSGLLRRRHTVYSDYIAAIPVRGQAFAVQQQQQLGGAIPGADGDGDVRPCWGVKSAGDNRVTGGAPAGQLSAMTFTKLLRRLGTTWGFH